MTEPGPSAAGPSVPDYPGLQAQAVEGKAAGVLAQEVEDGRSDIDRPAQDGHFPVDRGARRLPGQEDAVLGQIAKVGAVALRRFPVVGEDDEERIVVEPVGFEGLDDPAELAVDLGDRRIVEPHAPVGAGLSAEIAGRGVVVGPMGHAQVDRQEEAALAPQVRDRGHDVVEEVAPVVEMGDGAVHVQEGEDAVAQRIVEEDVRQAEVVEAAEKEVLDAHGRVAETTEALVLGDIAEPDLVREMAGRIAQARQDVAQSLPGGLDVLALGKIEADTARPRILPGQDRVPRGERPGDGRVAIREDHVLLQEGVQVRGDRERVSGIARVPGVQGVQADQDDVRPGVRAAALRGQSRPAR